jgi:histidine triad (HIT) family protein
MAEQPDFDNMTPEQIAEYQRQNCIFCKIIKGEIPSRKAYDDDKIISILDINPAAKGHLLVMTKEHYPILPLIPFDTATHMFRATKGLATGLKQAVITNKITIFIANGAVAGQQSPHFLYHIVPRENNDGLDNFIVPVKDYKEEENKPAPINSHELAKLIEDNPKIKEMILNNPEDFKKELEANPEIKKLFSNLDIDKLSQALSAMKKG